MSDEENLQYKESLNDPNMRDSVISDIADSQQSSEEIVIPENYEMLIEQLHKQNENEILNALKGLYNLVRYESLVFPVKILEKFIDLLSIQNEELHNELIYVLIEVLRQKNDSVHYLKENGLLDYIEDQFPSFWSTKILYYTFKQCNDLRFYILDNLLQRFIEILQKIDDDLHFIYLTEICSLIVSKKITKDVSISLDDLILLFENLLDAFLRIPREDVRVPVKFAEAFSFFIDSNYTFIQFFCQKDLIDLFIHYPCDDPEYVENVLLMCSTIARFNEDHAKYLESRHAVQYCEHYLDSDNMYVLADAFHVLTELLIFIPELSNYYISHTIIHQAVHTFHEENMSVKVQKAILRLAIFMINYIPSAGFQLVEDSGLYNILFENCPITDKKDAFFAINAIYRLFQEGDDIKYTENPEEVDPHGVIEQGPEVNVDLIDWLNDQRHHESQTTQNLIDEIIKHLKHEHPVN